MSFMCCYRQHSCKQSNKGYMTKITSYINKEVFKKQIKRYVNTNLGNDVHMTDSKGRNFLRKQLTADTT